MIISEDKKNLNTCRKSFCSVILKYFDHLCVQYLDPYISSDYMCLKRQYEGRGRHAHSQLSQISQKGWGESSRKNNGTKVKRGMPDPGEWSPCYCLSSLKNITKRESKSIVAQIYCPVTSLNFPICCQFVSLKDV